MPPAAPPEDELDAGAFSAWADRTVRAQAGDGDAEVPCGTCDACCRSGYFVHVEPDERETLRRIPAALRFPAPGRPAGHVVLPHRSDGSCALLVDGRCSIYEHRPRTCRRFDCRVLAAAGVDAEADGKPLVALQVRRWRFRADDPEDGRRQRAVRAAAAFLAHHPECFPRRELPGPTQLAMAALDAHPAFLHAEAPGVEEVRRLLATGAGATGRRSSGAPTSRRRGR